MKKLVYLALGAALLLGSAACGDKPNENNKQPTQKDPGYVPPDQTTTTKLEFGAECTPSMKNPCKDGLTCTEIEAYGIALCMQNCTVSADCPDGMLCGKAKETKTYEFAGVCVDPIPNYAFCVADGLPMQCGEGAICTEGYDNRLDKGSVWYAKYFFNDAGADDPLKMMGFCIPVCNTSAQENTCPAPTDLSTDTQTASMFDFAFWGINKETMSCVPVAGVDGIGMCAVAKPRTEGSYCDGNLIACSDDQNTDAICLLDDIFFDGAIEDTDAGQYYAGYDSLDRVHGTCRVLCEENATCLCAPGSTDINCQDIPEGTIRACGYFHKDGATNNNDDLNGYCMRFKKCNTKEDCTPLSASADCIDPAEGVIINKAKYTLPADFPAGKICW